MHILYVRHAQSQYCEVHNKKMIPILVQNIYAQCKSRHRTHDTQPRPPSHANHCHTCTVLCTHTHTNTHTRTRTPHNNTHTYTTHKHTHTPHKHTHVHHTHTHTQIHTHARTPHTNTHTHTHVHHTQTHTQTYTHVYIPPAPHSASCKVHQCFCAHQYLNRPVGRVKTPPVQVAECENHLGHQQEHDAATNYNLHKGTNPNQNFPLYYLQLVAASCSYQCPKWS